MVRVAQSANALLGESPTWDSSTGLLYWVDIKRPAIFRFDPTRSQTVHWSMSRAISCLAPTLNPDRLVFADADGFGFLDLSTSAIDRIADPEADLPGNRFNDGKVDRRGRLWAGTMDDQCIHPTGSLYRLDPDGKVHKMATGFICSNGLGWSPDDRTMYFTDSMVRTIWAYEFDIAEAELGERRVFANFDSHDGVPDGLTVDSEGFVWSAIWDGWRLVRFAPDGAVDREIQIPVQRPSSCAFGGSDLKTLYVTSARIDLDSSSLKRGPLAGALFSLEPGVSGLAETPFGAS